MHERSIGGSVHGWKIFLTHFMRDWLYLLRSLCSSLWMIVQSGSLTYQSALKELQSWSISGSERAKRPINYSVPKTYVDSIVYLQKELWLKLFSTDQMNDCMGISSIFSLSFWKHIHDNIRHRSYVAFLCILSVVCLSRPERVLWPLHLGFACLRAHPGSRARPSMTGYGVHEP